MCHDPFLNLRILCHPERSIIVRKAKDYAESKDTYSHHYFFFFGAAFFGTAFLAAAFFFTGAAWAFALASALCSTCSTSTGAGFFTFGSFFSSSGALKLCPSN